MDGWNLEVINFVSKFQPSSTKNNGWCYDEHNRIIKKEVKKMDEMNINRKVIMKWVLITLLVIIVLTIIGYGLTFLFRPAEVIEKVTKPDRIIYSYEWFFNTGASIKSYESQIQVAKEQIENFKKDHQNLDSYENSTELARLQSVLQGLKNQFITTVNSYNANAQNITRAYFKDWRLPKSIEIDPNGKIVEHF